MDEPRLPRQGAAPTGGQKQTFKDSHDGVLKPRCKSPAQGEEDEMKGPPRPTADKSQRLCSRKWLMLFPLKFQRNNRQDALAVDSAKRKNEKAVFSPRCGDETTGYYDRANPKSSRTPTASPPNRAYRRTKDPLRPQPHRSPYRRQKADKGAHQAGGPESRTAHYQVGDIRSYLFNNITFYRTFLQSPHSRLPTRLPPPLLPGWMSRKSKPGGAPRPPRCGYPPSARIGFFCLIQRIKSFSACILQRVSLRLSLQGYGDA